MSHTQPNFSLVSTLAFAMCLIALVPACSKTPTPSPPQSAQVQANPDEMMAQWRKMMETPSQSMEDRNLTLLAIGIGQSAPHYVDEMIAGLDDASLSGDKLIALVASLEEVVSPASVSQLAVFTELDRPSFVRGAATYLLGRVESADATAALEVLRDDENGRVRLSALLGLADRGDSTAGQGLRDFYAKEGTTIATQQSIVLAVSQVPRDSDKSMFEDVLQTEGFEQRTYLNVASALGRIGTTESISALNALKERPDCEVVVRDMCDNAIAAIEERSGSAAAEST